MDALAGRKTAGHMQGQIWVDGHPKVQSTFARVSGYVEQVFPFCLPICKCMMHLNWLK